MEQVMDCNPPLRKIGKVAAIRNYFQLKWSKYKWRMEKNFKNALFHLQNENCRLQEDSSYAPPKRYNRGQNMFTDNCAQVFSRLLKVIMLHRSQRSRCPGQKGPQKHRSFLVTICGSRVVYIGGAEKRQNSSREVSYCRHVVVTKRWKSKFFSSLHNEVFLLDCRFVVYNRALIKLKCNRKQRSK